MPRVTFIYPCIGRAPAVPYARSWHMQPLAIAVLAALTPPHWQRRFYDDRFDAIPYDEPTDLVALSVETYTARRAYQIAARFRERGVRVVLGGYHVTLCPTDAAAHADAICIGEAEEVWPTMLADAAAGRLQQTYRAPRPAPLGGLMPDRAIFQGKQYLRVGILEAGRGCPYACSFCSISAFHQARYRRRPIADIVEDVRALQAASDFLFFVDDNFTGDGTHTKKLLRALQPLGITWTGQANLAIARDPELLRLLVASGCAGLLIGFESLDAQNLASMNKPVNSGLDYDVALRSIRRAGLMVYGTFVFGYPHDTPAAHRAMHAFALRNKLFLAAFNHVVPFPGTPLYRDLLQAGRLPRPQWWLDPHYRFGDVAFEPVCMSATQLMHAAHAARRQFYRVGSMLRRICDLHANCRTPRRALQFLAFNWLMRRELSEKFRTPLGIAADDQP